MYLINASLGVFLLLNFQKFFFLLVLFCYAVWYFAPFLQIINYCCVDLLK